MWKTLVRVTTTAYNFAVGFGIVVLVAAIFEVDWGVALPAASIAGVSYGWFRSRYPHALTDNGSAEEAIAAAHGSAHRGSGS